jgi:hypothetical protein
MTSCAMVSMKALVEFKGMPLLCVCASASGMKELVKASKNASRGSKFVLLLDYDTKLIPRILPAFVNARIRMDDGIARSKSLQMEMLLLICGSMKIDKALKACGAKDAQKFLLFATDEASISEFARKSGAKVTERLKMQLDPRTAGRVAMTELLSE